MGGGSGGCQQQAEAAAEVRRGGELGKRKSSANVGVGMQVWVRGELHDVLGVQKKARSREQELASFVARVAAWATAVRRGEAGKGPARVLGWHVALRRAARGRPVLGTWPVKAAVVGRRENRGGGSWR
jgi:hypothetical protein